CGGTSPAQNPSTLPGNLKPPEPTNTLQLGTQIRPPHEMSYSTVINLQYAATPAQESGYYRSSFPQIVGPGRTNVPSAGCLGRVDTGTPYNRTESACRPKGAARFISTPRRPG